MPLDMGSLSLGELPESGESPQLPKPVGKPRRKTSTKPKEPIVLYYKHSINDPNAVIELVLSTLDWVFDRPNGTIVSPDGAVYKVNSEFHVTVLFLHGSDEQVKAPTLTEHLDAKVSIRVTEIGVNDQFICIRVEGIECDTGKIPYYGNAVRHITFARADPIDGGEKPQAKNSHTALNPETGRVIRLADPVTFSATFGAHMSS
jgi:hypothetical protein